MNRNWSNFKKFSNVVKEEKRVNKQRVSISLTQFDFYNIKNNKNKHRFEHIKDKIIEKLKPNIQIELGTIQE